MTYFIQRSRYLKEIEPDLDLIWPEKIRIGDLKPSLKDFGHFYIDICILNRSTNHAYDLSHTVDLTIIPQRNRSDAIESKHIELIHVSPKVLLAGRSDIVPIYIGVNSFKYDRSFKNHFFNRLQSLPADLRIENAGFMATITFEYFTKRDAVLVLLNPFGGNRIKYHRSIYSRWGFCPDTSASPPYTSRKWTIPNLNLDD
ncbi:MAG: hypothetical protein ABSB31_05605 [Dehalococcoidia bacterium]